MVLTGDGETGSPRRRFCAREMGVEGPGTKKDGGGLLPGGAVNGSGDGLLRIFFFFGEVNGLEGKSSTVFAFSGFFLSFFCGENGL